MNYINLEGNTDAFWCLFDKVFNRENITKISFPRNEYADGKDAVISSVGKDEEGEPIKSTLKIGFDDEVNGYVAFLTFGGVEYGVEYYIPSKVLSEKLGNDLWRTVRKQLRDGR